VRFRIFGIRWNSLEIARQIRNAVLVVCAIHAGGSTVTACPRSIADPDLNRVWIAFRNAALQQDWSKLEEITNFPLIVRGELDQDPIFRIDRSKFPTIFERFLKEGVFSPNEQLQVIRNTTTIKVDANSRDRCRIGDMVFKRTAKGWRLYTLYMQYSLD
jgi:hypothetical protein